MAREKLGPGEVRIEQSGPGRPVRYERLDGRGELEQGILAPADACNGPGSGGLIEIGRELRHGVHEIISYQPFTARGPAQVSSAAYRKGWDGAFGKRREHSSN